MIALFRGSVGLCALLGVAHLGVTFASYDRLSPAAIWFAGTGFALVLLAALNWAAWGARHPSAHVRRLVLALDLLMAAFGAAAVRAVPEAQAYVLLATFVGMILSGWFLDRIQPARAHVGRAP